MTASRVSGSQGASAARSNNINNSMILLLHLLFTFHVFCLLNFIPSATAAPLAPSCPAQCSCTATTVNCQGKGLTKVPANIPESTTILNLKNNQIKELGNASMSHLNKLKSLLLNDNQLTEIKSAELQGLVQLQRLQLSRNSLIDFPELGDACSSLTHLVLDQNKIKDKPVPSSFTKCSKILSMTLSKNSWSVIANKTFSALPGQLKSLKLNSINLKSLAATAFQSVSNVVTSLDLSENHDLPVEHLAAVMSATKFPMLTNLILKNMGFTNLPQNLFPVNSTPRLNVLHLEGCTSLTIIAATALDGCTNLQQLFLTGCTSLTGWQGSVIDNLNLKQLLLSNTGITTIGGVDGKNNSLKQLTSATLSKDGLQIMNTDLQCDCNLMWLTQLLSKSSKSASCIKDLAKVQIVNGSTHIGLMQCHPQNCTKTTKTMNKKDEFSFKKLTKKPQVKALSTKLALISTIKTPMDDEEKMFGSFLIGFFNKELRNLFLSFKSNYNLPLLSKYSLSTSNIYQIDFSVEKSDLMKRKNN